MGILTLAQREIKERREMFARVDNALAADAGREYLRLLDAEARAWQRVNDPATLEEQLRHQIEVNESVLAANAARFGARP